MLVAAAEAVDVLLLQLLLPALFGPVPEVGDGPLIGGVVVGQPHHVFRIVLREILADAVVLKHELMADMLGQRP